ncbi:LuxR C-terminal-related transcriptional regulator [Streptomyces sp. 4N509B]|uniref:LuxR C-terminal-related transcriptional regulator n=1 Tax=Streptomyces sp. 4N509B TaxID=3457413 RepID=UPI003FD336B3
MTAPPSLLTDTQVEILRHVAAGLTAEEIGRRTHRATATVHGHLQTAYHRLGARNAANAVALALAAGLIEPPTPQADMETDRA